MEQETQHHMCVRGKRGEGRQRGKAGGGVCGSEKAVTCETRNPQLNSHPKRGHVLTKTSPVMRMYLNATSNRGTKGSQCTAHNLPCLRPYSGAPSDSATF